MRLELIDLKPPSDPDPLGFEIWKLDIKEHGMVYLLSDAMIFDVKMFCTLTGVPAL
jgi:hypothetical protein